MYQRPPSMDFRRFLGEYSLPSDSGGIAHTTTSGTTPYQTTNVTAGSSAGVEVPQHNIGLPQVTRRGKVVSVRRTAGGRAEVSLDDRTVLNLTGDEYRRIEGQPIVPGRTVLTVTFQRNPGDQTQASSQITRVSCEDSPQPRIQQVR